MEIKEFIEELDYKISVSKELNSLRNLKFDKDVELRLTVEDAEQLIDEIKIFFKLKEDIIRNLQLFDVNKKLLK